MTASEEMKLDLREAPRTRDKILAERRRVGMRAIELQRAGLNATLISARLGVSRNYITAAIREHLHRETV